MYKTKKEMLEFISTSFNDESIFRIDNISITRENDSTHHNYHNAIILQRYELIDFQVNVKTKID